MISPVTKEKIKAILREQVEYDPEPAIKQLEAGNLQPACDLFSRISDDSVGRCSRIQKNMDKIVAVLDAMMKEMKS